MTVNYQAAVFNCVKKDRMYYYQWLNMPEEFKSVLSPNQYTIRCKSELSRRQLEQCAYDIHEAYAVELEWKKQNSNG